MDNLKQLIETQKNLRRIEKEVNKYRIELIKQYQNKSNLESLYNYLLIWNNYKTFSTKLKSETVKFEKLLEDSIISCNLKMNESLNENNSEYNEIMTNVEKFEQDSETSQDVDFSAYDGSTFLEQQSISISTTNAVNMDKNDENKNDENKNDENKNDEKEAPIITKPKFQEINNDSNQKKKKNKKIEKRKKKEKKYKYKYKYNGSVFKEFWIKKNKNKPIYTSTILYCTEKSCGQNEEKLTQFLQKYGHFNKDSIGTITFKSNWKGDYALIRINHRPLKSIKNKIKKLNKNQTNGEVLSIFQSKNVLNYNPGPSSIVFIYNFDITGIKAHKALTDLLLKYGDFKKDISIRTDKNGDPFAIVYYLELQSAQNLFYKQSELKFGDRNLTVSFSQYPDHLYN